MRGFLILMLSLTLGVIGCDSSSSNGTGGAGGSGGDGGTGGQAGMGGSGGSGGGDGTPIITEISWEADPGCAQGESSDVVVTVLATDSDTESRDLIYTGSVGGCQGPLDAEVSTINCPNVAPYPGTVMVADPDGNSSLPVTFDVPICADGSCVNGPTGCN